MTVGHLGHVCVRGRLNGCRIAPALVLVAVLSGAVVCGASAKRADSSREHRAIAQVSNVALPVSVSEQAAVARRDGDVLCLIEGSPTYRHVVRVNFGSHGALLTVLNVTCNVYPHRKAPAAQVDRVAAALRALARQFR